MIPFLDFGGAGPALVFAHANGYPPAAYRALLSQLAARFHVTALLFRPLWPEGQSAVQPDDLRDWNPFAQDVIQFLDERGERGVIGVGHSLGAVSTLAAALRRPELFRAVVLLDPVVLRRRLLWLWNTARRLGLAHRLHPLIPSTLRRRRVFASAEEMVERYRRAPVFARLSDAALRDYVNALVRPRADGQVELAYTPEWEVAIYANGPLNLWKPMEQLRVPLLVIRGAETDTFFPKAARNIQRRVPHAVVHTVPEAGHLVPMEKPDEVARLIVEFLETKVQ